MYTPKFQIEHTYINEQVNRIRQLIRADIEYYVKYIKSHITLQEDSKKLCCGLQSLNINDIRGSLSACKIASDELAKEIMDAIYSGNKLNLKNKNEDKTNITKFKDKLTSFQKLQDKYGVLDVTVEPTDQQILELIQKRYERVLKTSTGPVNHYIISHEEDNVNQHDKQVDYLNLWMSFIFFKLIDELNASNLLVDYNHDNTLRFVSLLLKTNTGIIPISIPYLESKIYEYEIQFSNNINPSIPSIQHTEGGKFRKKYNNSRRRPSRPTATKNRLRRHFRRRTVRK